MAATTEETTPAAQPESTDAAAPPAAPAETESAPAATTDAPAAAADDAAKPAEEAAAAAPAEPPTPPKVVIVTGASSGLGFEASRLLSDAGHDVILACRNEEKANRAIEKIKKAGTKGTLNYINLDLTSLESVRKFVDDFHATGKKLAVLINNAGVMLPFKDTKRQFTKDNIELTMGTNHIGHFVLTNLLLDDLKKTAVEDGDARIVVISSGLHDPEMCKKRGPVQAFDADNFFLHKDGTYNGLQAYRNSKLANILFTYELSRQLDGTGVKVNAVDPGFVPTTDLLRNASGAQKFFSRYILHGMLRFMKQTRTVAQAGGVITSVAVGDKFKEVTGKYIRDGAEVKSSEESLDEARQKKVWELSGGYARLEGFEPLEIPAPEEPKPAPEPVKTEEAATAANGEAAKDTAATENNKPAETTKEEAGENPTEEKKDEEKPKDEADKKPEGGDAKE